MTMNTKKRIVNVNTLLSVRTAAKRKVGLGEEQKSCKTDTAGASSLKSAKNLKRLVDNVMF